MEENEIPESPWSQIPRQPPMPVVPAPVVTPDMQYPSFPNPAGLGLQIPYPDQEPPVIPVPAMQEQMPMEIPMDPMMQEGQMSFSPWALLQMMQREE